MSSSADETFRRAVVALQAGNAVDAERLFKELLNAQPRHVAGLNLLGVLLTQLGKFEEAEHYVRRALNESATSDATFYNYGIILKALKRPGDALAQFSQALALNPAVAETWNNRGTVFNDLKRYGEAVADFDKAISINPTYAEAFCNKGKSLAALKSYDRSLSAFDTALALRPNLAEPWLGRGDVLTERKQYDDAFSAYDRALRSKPDLAEAWLGRGNIFTERKQYDEAFAAYDRALASKPDLAGAWLGRGNIFFELKQYDGASAAYERALTSKPDLAGAWLGRGNIATEFKRYDDAFAAYDRALALQPDLAEAWLSRGNIFGELKRYGEAFAAYDKAFALKPDLKHAEGIRLHAKLSMCDWTNLDAEVSHLISATRRKSPASTPYAILSIPSSPADQLQCARCHFAGQPPFAEMWRGEKYSHDRIRIGYVSANFCEHAVAYLIAGLFEQHDKSRFEITAISIGADQPSAMRDRIQQASEHFIDVRSQSDDEIAQLIRSLEIDIAVDLMGFTQDARPNVFARRPAPIQVNYLGYPGTMGADFFDYIIADRTIIPEDRCEFYSEKVVWLPDSYQVNDSRRRISERTPTRGECALPEGAFVFACFNNTFKIAPDVFDIWMRLLKATGNSVLWLLGENSAAMTNLSREAEKRGVASDRLIFAPRMALPDHLARHRQADLFLDTLPYNAHTTASDALWSGLPVLTCLGSTFAGRVAASLLKAAGLAELITTSAQDYEALALKLTQDKSLLASLRDRLARDRIGCPLFDTGRFARHIEAAYLMMAHRHQKGAPLQGFAVDPIS